MQERRIRRSDSRDDALQLLIETVADRAGGRGVALVDDRGMLLAGAGKTREMWGLARCVAQMHLFDRALHPHYVRVEGANEKLRLAAFALGESDLSMVAKGVERILNAA